MKIKSWYISCLLLFCCSCTGVAYQTRTQAPAPPEAAESVDAACSYFYFLWAKSAEYDHRYEEARQAYEKALVCDNGSEYVTGDLAVLLIRMDRKAEAVEWLRKSIEKKPADTGALSLLAKLYTGMGDTGLAIDTYRRILEIAEDQQTLLLLGTLYARDRQYEEAKKMMQRLVSGYGDSYLVHYYLAKLNKEMGFNDKAVASFEKALSINWSTALAFELAEFHEQQEDFAAAAGIYRRILENDAENESARAQLVNILIRMKEPDLALAELWKLRNYVEDTEGVDFTISHLLVTNKKYDEAIAILTAMLDSHPDLERSRYLLALAYQQAGKTENAKQAISMIGPETEAFENGVLLQAKILIDEEGKAAAISFLKEKTGEEKSRRKSFFILLASLYKEEQKPESGREIFEEALKVYPGDVELLYEYGLFLDGIGDQDGAIARMQELLALEPENGFALNYIGYVWADKGVNLDDALRYIEKAVSFRPDDGFIQDSLGWAYYKIGDIDRAVVEMEKAIELVDTDPIIFEHMGDVYLKAAQQAKARRAYEKSIELYKEDEKKELVRRKLESLGAE